MKNKKITIPFAITKVDEEQRRVWGVATSDAIDSQGDILDYEASKAAVSDWMKIGNIREMHDAKKSVGKAFDAQFDDVAKTITVGSYISKSDDGENTWIKIKEQILTGYSVGGSVKDSIVDKVAGADGVEKSVNRVTKWTMSELSLVDNPANPTAQIIMVKSVDGKGIDYIDSDQVEKFLAELDVKIASRLGKAADGSLATPWWMSQYQNEELKKAGVAQFNKSIDEKAKGTTMLTKAQKAAQIKKDFYGVYTLTNAALDLQWFLNCQVADGDEATATPVQAALTAIKDAISSELNDDEMLANYTIIEEGQKAMDLAKSTGNVREIVKGGEAVVDGDARDVNAASVAPTVTKPVSGGTVVPKAVIGVDGKSTTIVNKNDEPETPAAGEDEEDAAKTEPETPVVDPAKPAEPETPATPAAPADEAAKSALPADIQKSLSDVQERLLKFEEGQDLAKAVGDMTTMIEKRLDAQDQQIAKFAKLPQQVKVQNSYTEPVEVIKGQELGTGNSVDKPAGRFNLTETEVVNLFKRADQLEAHPSEGTPAERGELFRKLWGIDRSHYAALLK
jgi:hypothetical protein